jgi:hypothetical protein
VAEPKWGYKGTTEYYGKKPLTEKELAKKAGMSDHTYYNYRRYPDLRPEHAKRAKKP